jgi:FKBP-type peptidyl-prolyl cis-trans isomerase
MKLNKKLTASALAIGFSVAVYAQDASKTAPAAPAAPATPATPAAPAAPEFTEAQLLETFGWFIGKRIGLSELDFNKEQTDAIVKGLVLAASGKESPYDLQKIGPEMDKFMQAKHQQYTGKLRQKGMAESDKFMKEIKAKAGVVTTPSGLAYEIVQPGTGEFPKPTDMVKVHYTGALVNGTKFDSSVDRGEPVEFALSEVIPGWTEGIQKINKGGKIKLYIPPQLGYGDEAKPGIPPSSTLIFDVEVIDIKPAATPEPAPAPATVPAPAPAPAPTTK